MGKRNEIDGDVVIPGSLVVMGGFQNSSYSRTVTRLAGTEQNVTVIDGKVTEVVDAVITPIAPTNNVTALALSSLDNPNGTVDVEISWEYAQGDAPADLFLVYYRAEIATPSAIDLTTDRNIQVSPLASVTAYTAKLNLPTRQKGTGTLPIHYRFGVIAVATRQGMVVPHAGGVVEDATTHYATEYPDDPAGTQWLRTALTSADIATGTGGPESTKYAWADQSAWDNYNLQIVNGIMQFEKRAGGIFGILRIIQDARNKTRRLKIKPSANCALALNNDGTNYPRACVGAQWNIVDISFDGTGANFTDIEGFPVGVHQIAFDYIGTGAYLPTSVYTWIDKTFASKIQVDGNNFWNLATGEMRVGSAESFMHITPADGTMELGGLDLEITERDLRSYTGAGVQRRSVEVGNEALSWLDTPDTTPATPEQLRARIGRLGVGGDILLDGPFVAPISRTWSDESTVYSGGDASRVAVIERSNGERRRAYTRNWTVYEEIKPAGGSWGTAVSLGFRAEAIAYGEVNGDLRLAYRVNNAVPPSSGNLMEQVWSDGSSSWGTAALIALGGSVGLGKFTYVNDTDGSLLLVYATAAKTLVARTLNSGYWGSEVAVGSVTATSVASIIRSNGEMRVAYADGFGVLYEAVCERPAMTLTGIVSLTSFGGSSMDYSESIDGKLRIAYLAGVSRNIVERILGSSWGAPAAISVTQSSFSAYLQLQSGDLVVTYSTYTTNNLVERTLQRYARIGGGFTKFDSDVDGEYFETWNGRRLRPSASAPFDPADFWYSLITSLPYRKVTTLSTLGSGTFTPATGALYRVVIITGAGGGSGAARSASSGLHGRSGGGGGPAQISWIEPSNSAVVAYVVGAGGLGGSAVDSIAGNGGAGGQTSFRGVVVPGGAGSLRASGANYLGVGGAGATAPAYPDTSIWGFVRYNGGNGANGATQGGGGGTILYAGSGFSGGTKSAESPNTNPAAITAPGGAGGNFDNAAASFGGGGGRTALTSGTTWLAGFAGFRGEITIIELGKEKLA